MFDSRMRVSRSGVLGADKTYRGSQLSLLGCPTWRRPWGTSMSPSRIFEAPVGIRPCSGRALKATSGYPYRLRAYRAEAQTAHHRSDSCDAGRITEGIAYLRGVLTLD
jgi:hypothetical protein